MYKKKKDIQINEEKNPTCYFQDLVSKVVKCPEVRCPISMTQTSLKGEEP